MKKNHRLKTISETARLESGAIVNFGIYGAAISQILFVYYLLTVFSLLKPFLGAGLFVSGSIFLAIAGFESVKKNRKAHYYLSVFYFILITLGSYLLSYSFITVNYRVSLLACGLIILKIIFLLFYYSRKNYFKAEMWGIIFSTLWALIIYSLII